MTTELAWCLKVVQGPVDRLTLSYLSYSGLVAFCHATFVVPLLHHVRNFLQTAPAARQRPSASDTTLCILHSSHSTRLVDESKVDHHLIGLGDQTTAGLLGGLNHDNDHDDGDLCPASFQIDFLGVLQTPAKHHGLSPTPTTTSCVSERRRW